MSSSRNQLFQLKTDFFFLVFFVVFCSSDTSATSVRIGVCVCAIAFDTHRHRHSVCRLINSCTVYTHTFSFSFRFALSCIYLQYSLRTYIYLRTSTSILFTYFVRPILLKKFCGSRYRRQCIITVDITQKKKKKETETAAISNKAATRSGCTRHRYRYTYYI